LRSSLSTERIAGIAESAAKLAAAQGLPNSPEALATLPQLKTSDLPAKPKHIPTETGKAAGVTVLHNDVFANGVNYIQIDMDLAGLPAELYRWLPRYSEAIAKLGAAGQDFTRIAERRAACTGGLGGNANIFQHATEPAQTLRRFRFSLKTLDSQADNALALLGDLVFAVEPCDTERLRDVLTQTRASYRTELVSNGSSTAHRQATRGLSRAAAIDHLFFSPDALRFVEELTGKFDRSADELIYNIERIRDFVARRARWTVSFTGSEPVFRSLTRTLETWAGRRGVEDASAASDELPAYEPFAAPPREGWAGEMKIAHCVKAMPAPHLSHPDVPLFQLASYIARFDYFLPEIRFKGNAYGASVQFNDMQGTLCLSSFRDPNIVETLAVFDGLRSHVAAQKWSQTDIDRAIIGSAREAERPIRPAAATSMALTFHVRGDTDELREARYAAMLRATPGAVKETMLRLLEESEPKSAVCVVSSREKLSDANRRLGERGLAISDILP